MDSDDENIGKQIGNYLLKQRLGSGTFGSVYLAQHLHLSRSMVAIKLLNSKQLDSEEERKAFFNEAKFLDLLKHRYILPIIDVGMQKDTPYMVIEYASKGSLRDYIKHQLPARLPMNEVALILSEIIQALQFAHRHNVVHCDLKPENILFNEKGQAVLADFGIALQLKKETETIEDIKGTLPYMAPEQFDRKISVKSDQYALACIAYELLTGQVPIKAPPNGGRLQYIYNIMNVKPLSPCEFNRDLPSDIEDAILQALSKEHTKRSADVSAFLTAMPSLTRLLPVENIPTELIKGEELIKLQKMLAEPKKTIEQWLAEGDNYHKKHCLEEALEAYDKAILLGHNDARVYYARGNILYQLEKSEEALAAYEQAIQLGFTDAMIYYHIGYTFYQLKKLEEALVAYEQAIQLNSSKGMFHIGKGNVLRDLKHYSDALNAYDEAIRLSSHTPIVHINKGDVLMDIRDYKKAVEAYDQAIQVASTNKMKAKAFEGKGNALLRLRDYQEAIEAYERATQLDASIASASLYRSKGDAHWKHGQNEEALRAYDRGLELQPNDEVLQLKRTAMIDIINRTRRH